MPERRMSHIMRERDRLDQIEIQTQRSSDRSRNFGNKLNVERASCEIIVSIKRKNLRFIRITVIKRAVQNHVHIIRIRRPDDVVPWFAETNRIAVFRRIWRQGRISCTVDTFQIFHFPRCKCKIITHSFPSISSNFCISIPFLDYFVKQEPPDTIEMDGKSSAQAFLSASFYDYRYILKNRLRQQKASQ